MCEYHVRCAVKEGPRRGVWTTVFVSPDEDRAWQYCLHNKNRLGMLEMWRVIAPFTRESDTACFERETLHSIHYGTPAKQVKVTIVG